MMEQNLRPGPSCADPFGQMSGYVSALRGLTIFAKIENPLLAGAASSKFAGEEKLPSSDYEVAFVTAQGVPARLGRDCVMAITAREALKTYLAEGSIGRHAGRVIPI